MFIIPGTSANSIPRINTRINTKYQWPLTPIIYNQFTIYNKKKYCSPIQTSLEAQSFFWLIITWVEKRGWIERRLISNSINVYWLAVVDCVLFLFCLPTQAKKPRSGYLRGKVMKRYLSELLKLTQKNWRSVRNQCSPRVFEPCGYICWCLYKMIYPQNGYLSISYHISTPKQRVGLVQFGSWASHLGSLREPRG